MRESDSKLGLDCFMEHSFGSADHRVADLDDLAFADEYKEEGWCVGYFWSGYRVSLPLDGRVLMTWDILMLQEH